MKRVPHLILGVGLALAYTVCSAADECPPTRSDKAWSSTCFVTDEAGERRVRQEYVKRIKVNRQGVALIVVDDPRELLAVDRAGKVTIPGIRHTGDFDYPSPREGLGRYDVRLPGSNGNRAGKCGYFTSRTMRVAIPATFAQCEHFETGIATVCADCSRYCTVSECQHSILLEGEGLKIDRKGKILRSYALPKLTDFCRRGGTLKMEELPSGSIYIECVGPRNHTLVLPGGDEK